MKSKVYMYRQSWKKRDPDRYWEVKRNNNRKYNRKFPGRKHFANKVWKLLQQGRIKKKSCVECESVFNVQACSLSSPYDPLWLCDPCHKALHKRIGGFA